MSIYKLKDNCLLIFLTRVKIIYCYFSLENYLLLLLLKNYLLLLSLENCLLLLLLKNYLLLFFTLQKLKLKF